MAQRTAKTAKRAGKDRRARLEELKRRQRAAERRKTMLWTGAAVLVGMAIIAATIVPGVIHARTDPARKKLTAFGVSTKAAACSAFVSPPDEGFQHVGPGVADKKLAKITRVAYRSVPPTSGEHFPADLPGGRFYGPTEKPRIEQLVHNEQHGYVVLWYDATVRGKQLKTLQQLTARAVKDAQQNKFIAAPWDPSYGTFPAGKHIALATWGHKQLCGGVSGKVVQVFLKRFPPAQAPEPNGV